MQRKAFKKIGDRLAFNSSSAEAIFLIVNETELGFMYLLESTPFGSVQFVHREVVNFDEDEAAEEPAKTEEPTDGKHKSPTSK